MKSLFPSSCIIESGKLNCMYLSLAPMWNENFLFNLCDLDTELQLTVADKDPEFDDFIGHYKV